MATSPHCAQSYVLHIGILPNVIVKCIFLRNEAISYSMSRLQPLCETMSQCWDLVPSWYSVLNLVFLQNLGASDEPQVLSQKKSHKHNFTANIEGSWGHENLIKVWVKNVNSARHRGACQHSRHSEG